MVVFISLWSISIENKFGNVINAKVMAEINHINEVSAIDARKNPVT